MPDPVQPSAVPPATAAPVTPQELEVDRAIILGRFAKAIQELDAARGQAESWSRWLPGDSGRVVTPTMDAMRAKLQDGIAKVRAAQTWDDMDREYREVIAFLLNTTGTATVGLASQIHAPGFQFSRQAGIATGEILKGLAKLAAEVAGGAAEGMGLGTIALIGLGLWAVSQSSRPSGAGESSG